MSQFTETSSDPGWRTAIVAGSSLARRCVGRLESLGLEYQVVADSHGKSRILVRRNRLDEVVELLEDLKSTSRTLPLQPRHQPGSRHPVQLLLAIPLGCGIGLGLSAWLGVPATFASVLPAICAGLVCILVMGISRSSGHR